ncbi:MAG: hypothetical protein U5N85_07445 [Arcicella sp.]|nr:hypothetical protein [Arcicella sp.]
MVTQLKIVEIIQGQFRLVERIRMLGEVVEKVAVAVMINRK